jgi:hypothetical protein
MGNPIQQAAVQELLARGVEMPDPAQVSVHADVAPERIAPGVVLHPGVRLAGALTSIGPGCRIGTEGPAVLQDVQLGHDVVVRSGFVSGAVLLDGAEVGANAHIRPGTLLEEQAGCAHAVGLKQTILLSFVTTGSLINFCDCLMAGGTSRKDHSEVGSSYIHFNFTPHGDKATASLIGDVPRGVLLNQPPIFLGGQGGLVGPARVEYGVVIAAGVVQRKDALAAGSLYAGGAGGRGMAPRSYVLGQYGAIDRLVRRNVEYIGQVRALQAWYRRVRAVTMGADPYREACRLGAITQLDAVLKERIKRLGQLAEKMPASLALLAAQGESAATEAARAQQAAFAEAWPAIKQQVKQRPVDAVAVAEREQFLAAWSRTQGADHVARVRALSDDARAAATAWLQAIVDDVAAVWPHGEA